MMAPQTQSLLVAAVEAPAMHIRNTFLTVPLQSLPGRIRSLSAEPKACCDRYEMQVHALMFQPQPVVHKSHSQAQPLAADAGIESVNADVCTQSDDDCVSELSQHTASSGSATTAPPTPAKTACDESVVDGIELLLQEEGMESLLQRVPRDEEGELTSVGSILHARGTCKPCVFAHSERKACKSGASCTFCHFEHAPKRRLRVCKKKREELKRFTEEQRQQEEQPQPLPQQHQQEQKEQQLAAGKKAPAAPARQPNTWASLFTGA